MSRNEDNFKERSSEGLQKSLHENTESDTSNIRPGPADQAFIESKKGYRFLVDHIKEIVLVLDQKGKIIFANHEASARFGFSREELFGKSIARFLTGSSIPRALYALAQEFLGRPQPELEVQAFAKSGEIRHLKVAAGSAPIRDNGKVIGMMMSATDITREKSAEKQRQEDEKRFKDLWENAPVAYHRLDMSGIITNANQTEAHMLGYAKEELVGKSIFDFILPGQRTEAEARFQQQIDGCRISKAENRIFVKKDGSQISVSIDDSLERDGDGKVIGIRTTMVDITKLKSAEESLKKSEEHFRVLVEKSGIAILVEDEEGNFVYGNSRYAEIFGWPLEKMKSRPLASVVHPDDMQRVASYYAGRRQGDVVPSRYEFKGIRRDGSVIYLEVDAVVLREAGRFVGIRSYMWDITDRKRAEEKMRERRMRLDLMHQIQGEFLPNADIDSILSRTAERIAHTFGYREISISLYDPVADEIEYLAGWNKAGPAPPKGHRQKLGKSLIGMAAISKRSILANDVSKEPECIRDHGAGAKAELAIPLLVQNRLIGLLDLQAAEDHAFGKEDIAVLESMASYIAFVIDRKMREFALQESEEKFRNLAEELPNMIFINVKGRIVYANKKCEDIMGYKREEMYSPGFDFLKLIAPGSQDTVKTSSGLHRRRQNVLPYEYSLLTKDGKKIDVILTSKLIHYGSDKAILGIVTDITERKRAEVILQESEERYKSLFFEAMDGICLADAETGLITECNKTMAAMVGRDRAGLIGRHQSVLHPPVAAQESFSPTFQQHRGEKAGQVLENQIVTRTGQIRAVEIKANILTLRGRKILMGIFRDITERKNAEEALRESEEKHRTLTNHLNVGVYRNTAGPQGRFLEANPAIIEMFGYKSKKEFLAASVANLYQHAEDRKKFNDKMIRCGFVRNEELSLKKKDGNPFVGSLSTVAVKDSQGQIKYYDGIIEDITGRKQAEDELRQASNKLRQALGSIVSVVTATVEMKDPYTAGHQKRVADLARAIATEMQLSKDQIEGIRIAGTIHDLGKLFIPGEILSKPGALNEFEHSLIRMHSQVGFDILKDIQFPWPIAQIVYQHHERMDGSGYPQGLKGAQILMEARIIGVADVVEAMSSHRPYRPALGMEKALEEITRKRGMLYDPAVVNACLKISSEHKFEFSQEKK